MAIDLILHGDEGRARRVQQRLPYARYTANTGVPDLIRMSTTNWFFLLDVDYVLLDEASYRFLLAFDPDGLQMADDSIVRLSPKGFACCVPRNLLGWKQPYYMASPLRDISAKLELGEKKDLDTHEFTSSDPRAPFYRFAWEPTHYDWAATRTVHVLDRGCRFTLQPLVGGGKTEYQDLIQYGEDERMDVFMLTTGRDFSVANWERLKEMCPRAKLFRTATDIHGSHRAMAQYANTEHFFVVDGDNWVTDATVFDFVPRDGRVFTTHIWHATNPLGIEPYGHGAIKLFPKHIFLGSEREIDETNRVDVTMNTAEWIEVHPVVASEHRFNTDYNSVRRTAGKEMRKLAQAARKDDEALARLKQWAEAGRSNPAILRAIQEQA